METNIGKSLELVMTDEFAIYPWAFKGPELAEKHRIIKHKNKQYVEGIVHTNSIESAFSLLKRGS